MYHPNYGYTDCFRITVCKTAVLLGKKRAVTKHKVSITSIYNWLKVYPIDTILRGH